MKFTSLALDLPHCVYKHFSNGELIYVGRGSISRAFDFTQRNAAWFRYVEKYGVDVEIVGLYADKDAAKDNEALLITEHKPPCNFIYRGAIRDQANSNCIPVMCIETGHQFKSCGAAAKYFELNPSHVAAHIRGDKKRSHIKGFTFCRVTSKS